ncbi:MAG: formylglycine-generating enzyme family protein [Magnetococcales bacterium]|nr:formylglycine-generating enzyme family protein [Magnetococcales bacterium]
MKTAKVVTGLVMMASLLSANGAQADEHKEYTNSIGMAFVEIPAGQFEMGTHQARHTSEDESPPHRVHFSQPFCLGKQEVTQGQWEAIMGQNPSRFKGTDHPVERVSWRDAQEFIRLLNVREGVTGYRLPTEAEWEYAARAGTTTAYYWGNTSQEIEKFAWHEDNASGSTHAVGTVQPNGWGLYDMAGNVSEWCQDWYQSQYYATSPEENPSGPAEGVLRIQRGGSWNDEPEEVRSAFRGHMDPGNRNNHAGLRLVGVCP